MSNVLVVNPKNPSVTVLQKAVAVIRAGGLIVYPTDTVYGLGVNALNPQAVRKIFEVKERPYNQPLPVAVSGLKMAEELAYITDTAKRLIAAFWPGALTIVLKRKPRVPSAVTGGTSKVGLRAPNHNVPLSIITFSHLPLITTSANKHGAPPCIEVDPVVSQLGREIDLIIDGGRGKREVSTIIDLSKEPPIILRKGPVTRNMIEQVIGLVREP